MSIPADMDPYKTPLMLNPDGSPPNFTNPPTLLDTQFGVGVMLIVLGAIFVFLRVVTNLKITRKLCLDDILCIFAFVSGVAYWTLSYLISKRGTARHAWDTPISVMADPMLQLPVPILQMITAPAIWAAKAAILALYVRIFGVHVWLRRTAYFWIIFMALFYGMNIVAAGVYCIPRPGESGMGASFARCSSSAWISVVGVFSCLADLIILALPFPLLLKLHISLARKISLSIIFGTGLLLVILSVVSLYLRVRIFQGYDPTWDATALGIVTTAEIFGTIIVSCAPAMSSFWLNILVKSNLWSELKSSFLPSRRSQGSKEDLGVVTPRKDSKSIIKETRYEVLEDGSSRKSSNHASDIPLSSLATTHPH